MSDDVIVKIKTNWRSVKTGDCIKILLVCNLHSSDHVKLPICVVFEDERGMLWSLPLMQFKREYKLAGLDS